MVTGRGAAERGDIPGKGGWQTYTIARQTMAPSAAAAQLGLIGLLQFIPLFVTTPITGWVADRFDRRCIPQPHADPTEDAAAWLAALDAGSTDVAAFEAWRGADIRHAVAFAEVAGTWRDLDQLRVAHGEIKALPAARAVRLSVATRPDRRHFPRAAASIAAVAAIGGGVAYPA